jgi:hypothetical protein
MMLNIGQGWVKGSSNGGVVLLEAPFVGRQVISSSIYGNLLQFLVAQVNPRSQVPDEQFSQPSSIYHSLQSNAYIFYDTGSRHVKMRR